MQRLFSILFCVFLFFPAAVSFAAEVAVIGPQLYIRTTGAPNVYEDTFSALPKGARLVIFNGSEIQEQGKSDRVSSGYVYINDQLIFGPEDFKQQRHVMEVPVTLKENNTIRVELRSIPNSFLSLSLIQNIPPPTINLEASSLSIMLGTNSTLTWSSEIADTVSIDQGIGTVALNGSTSVSPEETTTYTVTANNRGGSSTASVTVEVRYPVPTVTLHSSAEEVKSGESAILTWSSTGAETLNIEPGIGSVTQGGITSVTPVGTTIYTITASGRGGTATASVTIRVTAPSIDLVAVSPEIDDASCPDSINLSVQLQNSGEGIAEAGVAVTFYNGDPQNGGVPIGTARSVNVLDPGGSEKVSLQWPHPPVGGTKIYVRIDDIGNGEGQFEETNEENNFVTYDISVCEELQDPDANSISGEVIDAVTGERLSNVVVDLHVSISGVPGPVLASFRTNFEGIFIFRGLVPGAYIITGKVAGYADGERPATLVKNAVLEHQNLVLSPVLQDDDIRIVLTWGQNPEDLEAHLTGPNPDGCRDHCFYWNKEIPGANLDLDDRHSYGPETITVTDPGSGTYHYYVHNFTNRSSLNNFYLSYYGAEVKVYLAGATEPLVFTTPVNRYTPGTVWHVFDLDGETGKITPVNKFTHQVEPGQIDFPRINPIPSTYAYWGQPYTYQITAEDPDDDPLNYTLLQGPEGMRVDPETGLLEWTPLGIPAYYNPVTVKVSDGHCGEDTQSYYLYVNPTPTATFTATPCSAYNEKGDIILTWDTAYAKTVLIDQGIGEVAAKGSMAIPSPESPVVYTLTAFNDAAATVRKVPAAAPSPYIYFSPTTIEPTSSATLYWSCGCAAFCAIDQGIGKVSGTGSMQVSPMDTTTYTITASNAVGERKYVATLTTGLPKPPPPPVIPSTYISSFSANPSCDWSPPAPITLSWSTVNATSCEITPGVGPVACNGYVVVNPEKAGTYTLTARGESGVYSTNVSFPTLPYTYGRLWVAPSGYVKPGDEVVFNWSTSCADTVTISGIGEVGSVGSRAVTVPDVLPRLYTMTATNEAGSSSYSILLQYFSPTGTFTTDDSVIKVGESSVLRWTSQYADKCTITPNVGEVDCKGGSVTVTPDKPTSYFLKVEGAGGTSTYSLYVNFVPPDVDIQATPETIKKGESTKLSWIFSNATSCSIDQGIGAVQLGETLTVSPLATTTYKISAVGPGGTQTDQVTVNVIPANPPPTATITVNPGLIWNGGESTLAWSSEYASTVTITPDIGTVAASGTRTIKPIKDTTYTITATGSNGNATAQVRITVLQYTPTANLTATPENIELGGTSVLSWTTEHADTVTITPDIGTVTASGSRQVSPAKTTTYTITAKGLGGTTVDQVTVSYSVPTVTLAAAPVTINYPGKTTLSWSSTNATSVTISPNIGAVNPSGTVEVAPPANTTYTITATGPGGSVNKSATVTVIYPQPTATLSAQPDSINKGDPAQLTWSAEYADSCTITPLIGSVPCSGTRAITPADTTTYTITATGPGGSASKSAMVTVIHPAPTVTLSAEPSTIKPGESTILKWTSMDAVSVTLDQGIGVQSANGQVTVSPNVTTTYTLMAEGPGGSASAKVQITVTGELIITLLEPLDQQTVASKKSLVHGRLATNAPFANVQINGKRAVVENKEFFLNDLEVSASNLEIKVEASDSNRSHAIKTISVFGDANKPGIELTIGDPIGIIPFNIRLQARLTSGEILPDSASASWTGPGDVTVSKINDSEFSLGFTQAGLYTITYTAKDSSGLEYTAQQMIAAREPTSDEEWQAMASSVEQLENLFLGQVGVTDIDTLRQQVVELAQANADFSSVKLSDDDLCLVYKGRIPVILDLSDPNTTKPTE